jgi:hypothetical protein
MSDFLEDLASMYNAKIETKVYKWNDTVSSQTSVTKFFELNIRDWTLDLEYVVFPDPDSGIGERRLNRHRVLLRCRIDESKFDVLFTINRKTFWNQLFRKKTNRDFIVKCKNETLRNYLRNSNILANNYSENGLKLLIQTWREKGCFYFSAGYEGILTEIQKETFLIFDLGKDLINYIDAFCQRQDGFSE